MQKLRLFLYGLFTAGCVVFFAVILFPQKMVGDFIAGTVNRVAPGWTVSIEKVGIAFPARLQLTNCHLFHLNRPIADADKVFIKPRWLSFFSSPRRFDIHIIAHGGLLDGTARIASLGRPADLQAKTQISGLEIESIPALKNGLPVALSGKLNGQIDINSEEDGRPALYANLVLSDTVAVWDTRLKNQGRFHFDRIEAETRLQDRRLQVQKCIFSGKQLNGTLTGNGIIKSPLGKSEFFLTGTLQVIDMETDRMALQLRAKPDASDARNGLTFRIQGPVDNLRFYL